MLWIPRRSYFKSLLSQIKVLMLSIRRSIYEKNVQSGVLFVSILGDRMRSSCSVAKRTGKSCRRSNEI